MTDTLDLRWYQTDERPQNREDSMWYTFGYGGHDLIVSVGNGENSVSIYADGEMRIQAFTKEGDSFVFQGIIRYCDQLEEYGIRADDDLWGLPDNSRPDGFDVQGPNGARYYFQIDNNSWFDIYNDEDGEHLDCVCDTLSMAIEQAGNILADGLS